MGVEDLALFLIGPLEKLSQVKKVVMLGFDHPDASLGMTLYLMKALAGILPTWTDIDE